MQLIHILRRRVFFMWQLTSTYLLTYLRMMFASDFTFKEDVNAVNVFSAY